MKKIDAKLKTSKGELIQLEDWSYRIGGFEGVCNYVIENIKVSPVHGVIEYKNNKWYIQDTNSAAGIFINDQKIDANLPVLINQNDRIKIVDTTFEFIMDLELFKNEDIRLINDLYKNWLFEHDESMQLRLKKEITHIIQEKLILLGKTVVLSEKETDDDSQTVTELLDKIEKTLSSQTDILENDGETEVLSEEDSHGDAVTTVLNEEDGNEDTTVLNEELGETVTTVLVEENKETEALNEEKNNRIDMLEEEEDDTVVLNEDQQCTLKRVNSNENAIKIDKMPFIIGKATGQVDYCLNERGISRRQSKIYEGNNHSFCITDLDSRNGTYVNGRRVTKEITMEINDGDMVSFAEYNYIVSIM